MAPFTPRRSKKEKVSLSSPGSFVVDDMSKLAQTIKVAVRIRPLHTISDSPSVTSNTKNELSEKEKRAWKLKTMGATDVLIQKGASRKVDGRTVFHFDSVFDENTQTPLIYKRIARPMVKTVVSGKHATIFAYGQTGSGKTFTMQGDGRRSGQAGIIQLVASDMFRFMKQGGSFDRSFVVKVSYIEIYNERIRDLLSDDAGSTMSHGTSNSGIRQLNRRDSHLDKVNIRATSSGEVMVNCIQNEVTTVDEVLTYLTVGNSQRMVAKTDMNNHSSRSHAIFRLTVESKPKEDPGAEGDDESGDHEILRVSDFNLVDLAGSESVKMSNTSGIRLREGAKINQSLLSLSTVIHSLSLPEKKRPKHINYRDSKLTRMLQPHLSGNAEIAVVCCISPHKMFTEETRTTLKFATRAKLISVKPKINEILDDTARIKKLQHELAKAKKMIEQLSKGAELPADFLSVPSTTSPDLGMSERTDDYLGASDRTDPLVISIRSAESGETSDYRFEDMVESKNYVMPAENGEYKKYTQPLKEQSPTGKPNGAVDNFKLDAVPEDVARKTIFKFMKGKDFTDSSSSDDDDYYKPDQSKVDTDSASVGLSPDELSSDLDLDDVSGPSLEIDRKGSISTKNITAKTEDETYDGPPASYRNLSFRVGKVSVPDTIGINSLQGDDSRYGTADQALDGRTNEISWDTMGLNTSRPEHVGQPLRALKSLNEQSKPIPKHITIISSSLGEEMSLADKIESAERQASFLKSQLEVSDDLIESVFKDLERARLCIHDLVYRNVQLATKLKEKRRQNIKDEYEESELAIEQYWLLKGSMYVGLFFFFTGGYEYFMASVIFLWLLLEATMS